MSMDAAAGDKRWGSTDMLFFLGTFVFAYLHLFRLPATPIYFDGDTLVPVSNAVRMLSGEAIFKDFFHFVAPGADLLYATLFYLFGSSVWVVNGVVLGLTMLQVWLLWIFARRVLNGAAVYLPALIFLVLGFRQFGIDGSQRLMSVVLAFAAVAAIAAKRDGITLVLAGVLAAGGSFFQQQRGVLVAAGILVFLLWEWRSDNRPLKDLIRSAAMLAGSFLITTALFHAFFLWNVGIGDYYYSMVGFISSSYRSDRFNNSTAYLADLHAYAAAAMESRNPLSAASRLTFISAFYYLLVPYVYAAFLIYAWLNRKGLKNAPGFSLLVLLCLTGLISAAGVSAPTIMRIFHVAIPAIIIFVWLTARLPRFDKVAPVLTVLFVVLCIGLIVQRQTAPATMLDMPAGRAAFLFEPTFEKYRWIGEHTHPGDIIYEPRHPNFYFPFRLRNPTPLNTVRDSAYTPAAQIDRVVSSLERTPPRLVIWPEVWSKDSADRVPGDNVGPLWEFVRKNYAPVAKFGPPEDAARSETWNDIVYERRAGGDEQ
jgi:hypothetical protein